MHPFTSKICLALFLMCEMRCHVHGDAPQSGLGMSPTIESTGEDRAGQGGWAEQEGSREGSFSSQVRLQVISVIMRRDI